MLVVHDDDLVQLLDGSRVSNERGSWLITVYCVYTMGAQRWVQVSLAGPRNYTVTLRMSLGAGAPGASEAISEWLRNPPATDGDIVSVP
jgi:hypothetical protein